MTPKQNKSPKTKEVKELEKQLSAANARAREIEYQIESIKAKKLVESFGNLKGKYFRMKLTSGAYPINFEHRYMFIKILELDNHGLTADTFYQAGSGDYNFRHKTYIGYSAFRRKVTEKDEVTEDEYNTALNAYAMSIVGTIWGGPDAKVLNFKYGIMQDKDMYLNQLAKMTPSW